MRLRHKLEADRKAAEAEMRLSVIPPEMRRTRVNFPGFNAGLLVRVEHWQPSGKWLGLVGGAGECKTRILAVIARRLILAGHRLSWTTATDMQDRVEDLHAETTARRAAQEYLREIKTTSILILDDIGKNTWTPSFEKQLFGLIDHRKTHDLPILWSANTSPIEILQSGQLSKDRGAPLIGRLLEASTIERA